MGEGALVTLVGWAGTAMGRLEERRLQRQREV